MKFAIIVAVLFITSISCQAEEDEDFTAPAEEEEEDEPIEYGLGWIDRDTFITDIVPE